MTEVSTHRTALVPVAITCPSWCQVDAESHASDLWNMDGDCIHYSADVVAVDREGYREAMTTTKLHAPIPVWITTMTSPTGQETATPIVHLDGHELSVQQAGDLAEALRATIELYRSTGGMS